MGLSQVGLPTRTKVDPAVRRPLDLTARLQECAPGRPRVVRMPDRNEEAGRGLQMVDALSDVWGWSPVTGRGKAVWAILFCALFMFC